MWTTSNKCIPFWRNYFHSLLKKLNYFSQIGLNLAGKNVSESFFFFYHSAKRFQDFLWKNESFSFKNWILSKKKKSVLRKWKSFDLLLFKFNGVKILLPDYCILILVFLSSSFHVSLLLPLVHGADIFPLFVSPHAF